MRAFDVLWGILCYTHPHFRSRVLTEEVVLNGLVSCLALISILPNVIMLDPKDVENVATRAGLKGTCHG